MVAPVPNIKAPRSIHVGNRWPAPRSRKIESSALEIGINTTVQAPSIVPAPVNWVGAIFNGAPHKRFKCSHLNPHLRL